MPHQALIVGSLGGFLREHPPIAMVFLTLAGICMMYSGFLGFTTGTFVDFRGDEYSGSMAKIGSAFAIGVGTLLLVLGIRQALIVLGASGQP